MRTDENETNKRSTSVDQNNCYNRCILPTMMAYWINLLKYPVNIFTFIAPLFEENKRSDLAIKSKNALEDNNDEILQAPVFYFRGGENKKWLLIHSFVLCARRARGLVQTVYQKRARCVQSASSVGK